jgi:Na+-translocating ferredoxin:NAD+ oxidoreductase RnfD subunit
MTSTPTDPRRMMLGVLSAVLLVGAVIVWWFVPNREGLLALFVRLGIALGAVYLAFPKPNQRFVWQKGFLVLLLLALLVATRGRALFAMLPLSVAVLGILWFLRPKAWTKPGGARSPR